MAIRNLISPAFAIFAIASPTGAYAQETTIACDILVTTKVNGRSTNSPPRSGVRYYVLDDSSRTFTPLANGEQKSYCGNNSGCQVTYTDTVISYGWADQELGAAVMGRIDRINGRISETAGFLTDDPQASEVIVEVNGPCRAVTDRRF